MSYVNQKNLMTYISCIIKSRFIHLGIESCHSSKTLKQIPLDSINLWSEVIWIHPDVMCVFCVFVGLLANRPGIPFWVPNPICVPKSFLKHEKNIPVIQSFHFYPNLQEDVSRFQLMKYWWMIHNSLTKIGLVNTEYHQLCHWFGTFSQFHPYLSDTNCQLVIETWEFLFWNIQNHPGISWKSYIPRPQQKINRPSKENKGRHAKQTKISILDI